MKRIATVALVAALATAMAACGGDDDDDGAGGAPDARAVTLVLNWTPNAHHLGVYAAQQQGWYRDAGIDLTIIEPAEAGAEAAVGSGRAEFGISIAEGILPARAQGVPIVSIGAILPVNDSALMSLASEGITGPADLAGATYGGYNGPLEAELIDRLAECGGADPSTIETVQVGNVDYLAGLESDRFDVVWVFAGWDALRASEIEDTPVNLIRFDDEFDCIPNWYTPLFITSESVIADDPALVRTFLDVTTRGYELAMGDPARAAGLMIDAIPEMDPPLIDAAAEYYSTRFAVDGRPFGTQDRATWVAFEEFLVEAGALEERVDVEDAFTDEYLPG